MPTRTGYDHGVPSWIDLSTNDVDAARTFYSELFGWEWIAGDAPDGSAYWMATIDGNLIAGVAELSPDMIAQGVPPSWNTFINVDDVKATTAKAESAGAQVLAGPMQIGESGTMSFVMDPNGAAIGMWQAGEHTGAQLVNEHGALTWNEVYARDTAATADFYGRVFGWTTGEMPGGDGNVYTTFVNGEATVGGTTQPPMEQVPPHWHVWFASDDVAATAAKAAELGARTLVPPMDTPMGQVASFHDPQGAVFSIITSPSQG
jgi:predicted enzyme related to lactoylglutathione lyase